MKEIKIVLFNAPPRAGKDTAAVAVASHFTQRQGVPKIKYLPYLCKFAECLKNRTHGLFGLLDVTADAFEHTKDTSNASFHGLSPRQAYIKVSENFMKPTFGHDIWGKILAKTIYDHTLLVDQNILAICSDFGFAEEVAPIVNLVEKENILIIQIKREGYDFTNDSRSYVNVPGVLRYVVENKDLATFKQDVIDLVEHWLGQ